MKKALLVVAGLGLALVAVLIFRPAQEAQHASVAAESTSSRSASAPGKTATPSPIRSRSLPAVEPRPELEREPELPAPEVDEDDYEKRNYVRDDGTVVRDHRAVPGPQNMQRRISMPKEISPVQPEVLAAVRRSVRPAMRSCLADLPKQNLEEGAKAQAELTVSIVDSLLQVDKLKVQTEGVPESDDLRSCMRDAILGHEVMVEGAKDVESHVMNFPYRL